MPPCSPRDHRLTQAPWDDTVDTLRSSRMRDEDWWDWRKRPARPVVFDAPALMTSDVVHLHLPHPFVRRLLARFSAQGFTASDLARVTVIKNPKDSLTRVVAYGRLTLYGRGATRLHEEVIPVAARWIEGRGEVKPFAEKADRDAVAQLEALFAQPELRERTELEVSEEIAGRLVAAAPRDFASLWPHVRADAEARAHDARTRLVARTDAEAEAMTRICRARSRASCWRSACARSRRRSAAAAAAAAAAGAGGAPAGRPARLIQSCGGNWPFFATGTMSELAS